MKRRQRIGAAASAVVAVGPPWRNAWLESDDPAEQSAAWRKNITGHLKGPVPVFRNVRRA
jgi:hypothetical protein